MKRLITFLLLLIPAVLFAQNTTIPPPTSVSGIPSFRTAGDLTDSLNKRYFIIFPGGKYNEVYTATYSRKYFATLKALNDSLAANIFYPSNQFKGGKTTVLPFQLADTIGKGYFIAFDRVKHSIRRDTARYYTRLQSDSAINSRIMPGLINHVGEGLTLSHDTINLGGEAQHGTALAMGNGSPFNLYGYGSGTLSLIESGDIFVPWKGVLTVNPNNTFIGVTDAAGGFGVPGTYSDGFRWAADGGGIYEANVSGVGLSYQADIDANTISRYGRKAIVSYGTIQDLLSGASVSNADSVGHQAPAYYLSRSNHTGSQAESTITGLTADLSAKQATLVSGTNIKTINSGTILGSGDIVTPNLSNTDLTATGDRIYNMGTTGLSFKNGTNNVHFSLVATSSPYFDIQALNSSGNGGHIRSDISSTLISYLHTGLGQGSITIDDNGILIHDPLNNIGLYADATIDTSSMTIRPDMYVTSAWVLNKIAGSSPAAPVTSVFTRTGAVVATSGDYNTSQVTEVTNLYHTNARVLASTLTGYTSGAGTVGSSDNVLQAFQKINGNQAADAANIATNTSNIALKLAISDTSSLARKTGNAAMQEASYAAIGTGGNGYVSLKSQSTRPTGVSGELRIYRDSVGSIAYINGLVRRTLKFTKVGDITTSFPYKLVSVLADSTDVATALAAKQATGNYLTALTGDATASGPGSAAVTFATVNSNVGTFGNAGNVSTITVNGKGLITAASNTAIQITESQVTNLNTDLGLKAPLISPAFTTPSLGVATATSINGNIWTTGTGTFTQAAGSTLQTTGAFTINLTATANTTPTFLTGSGTVPYLASNNAFTGSNSYTSTVSGTGASMPINFTATATANNQIVNGILVTETVADAGFTGVIHAPLKLTFGSSNFTIHDGTNNGDTYITGGGVASSTNYGIRFNITNTTFNAPGVAGTLFFRVANTTLMSMPNTGILNIVTAPTTATADTYDFLVRPSGTGNVEKVLATTIPITRATADLTAQTSAGNITTFTVGASTATFNISEYINVTAVSVDVIQGQITYTDENSAAQTISLANISAIGNSAYNPVTIRAKTGTVITVKTNLTTGAGTITFDAGARITQL